MSTNIFFDSPDELLGLTPHDATLISDSDDMIASPGLDGHGRTYELFDKGISLDFCRSSSGLLELESIFFFVSEKAALDASESRIYSVYSGKYPYGINSSWTKDRIRKKFGKPRLERTERQSEIVGFMPGVYTYIIRPSVELFVEFTKITVYRLVVSRFRE